MPVGYPQTAESPNVSDGQADRNRLSLKQESLYAFPGIDFSAIDVALIVGRYHMKPVEPATSMAEKSEVTERFALSAIYDGANRGNRE